MTFGNLIYLAMISGRVPVIPPFVATEHVEWGATPLPFGRVFDIPRFKQASGVDLLQWHEIKRNDSEVLDDLGCWSVWQTAHPGNRSRHSYTPGALNLG
jgi:hypothetical protein